MPTGLGTFSQWNGGVTRAVRLLLIINVVVFLFQLVFVRTAGGELLRIFSLNSSGFSHHYYWQFVTYLFLHGSLWHILLNMFTLFMIGPELERYMGVRGFLALYFLSGILGGMGWLALTYPHESVCVGASGAIFGLLGAFAALFPRRPITLLVFMILPLTLEAWVLVAGLALIQLFYLLSPGAGNVAYAAHLAGAVAGYAYARAAYRGGLSGNLFASVRFSDPRAERVEIDRILDKVATQGIQSLSRRERSKLEKASRR